MDTVVPVTQLSPTAQRLFEQLKREGAHKVEHDPATGRRLSVANPLLREFMALYESEVREFNDRSTRGRA